MFFHLFCSQNALCLWYHCFRCFIWFSLSLSMVFFFCFHQFNHYHFFFLDRPTLPNSVFPCFAIKCYKYCLCNGFSFHSSCAFFKSNLMQVVSICLVNIWMVMDVECHMNERMRHFYWLRRWRQRLIENNAKGCVLCVMVNTLRVVLYTMCSMFTVIDLNGPADVCLNACFKAIRPLFARSLFIVIELSYSLIFFFEIFLSFITIKPN